MHEETSALTIRIPKSLDDQIKMRARLQKRSRNAEIIFMLEEMIDRSVGRDLEIIKRYDGPPTA